MNDDISHHETVEEGLDDFVRGKNVVPTNDLVATSMANLNPAEMRCFYGEFFRCFYGEFCDFARPKDVQVGNDENLSGLTENSNDAPLRA